MEIPQDPQEEFRLGRRFRALRTLTTSDDACTAGRLRGVASEYFGARRISAVYQTG